MALDIVPERLGPASEPSVGIFWRIGGRLLVDRTAVASAEPYGDRLGHAAGHHEFWEALKERGAGRLRALGVPAEVARDEYDEWPRGRVVYEVTEKRFAVYADRRIHDEAAALVAAFGLAECDHDLRTDAHYR